jgi:hypothetical protein
LNPCVARFIPAFKVYWEIYLDFVLPSHVRLPLHFKIGFNDPDPPDPSRTTKVQLRGRLSRFTLESGIWSWEERYFDGIESVMPLSNKRSSSCPEVIFSTIVVRS